MKKNLFNRSLIGFLIIVLIVSFGLSGCRKKSPSQKTKKKNIELTYYKVFDDEEVIKPIIEKYETANPGITIKYRQFSDFREYQKVILNEMAEGEGPDIFSMPNTWFASNYKKIAPMPESRGTPDMFAKLFVDVAYKDLVKTDGSGLEQIYAVPLTVDTLALYYNKAHYEDRLPTNGKPADTWEGIKEDVAVLKKEDNSFERFEVAGIALGRADNIDRAVDIFYLLFLQFDGRFYNDNVSEATFAAKGNDATSYPAIEALELFTGFADPDQKHYTWNEYIVDDDSVDKEAEAFAKGKVSMIIGFSYAYEQIVNQINILETKGLEAIEKEDIGIAPIPQIYDPDISTEKRVTYASYFAETVSRNTKYSEEAWDFLVYMIGRDNLESYFEDTHKPTSRRDMINDQKKHPIYGVFASQIGYAESFPILDYYYFKDLFTEVINKNLDGKVNSNSLLEAQALINEMLSKEGLIFPKKVKEDISKTDDGED